MKLKIFNSSSRGKFTDSGISKCMGGIWNSASRWYDMYIYIKLFNINSYCNNENSSCK